VVFGAYDSYPNSIFFYCVGGSECKREVSGIERERSMCRNVQSNNKIPMAIFSSVLISSKYWYSNFSRRLFPMVLEGTNLHEKAELLNNVTPGNHKSA